MTVLASLSDVLYKLAFAFLPILLDNREHYHPETSSRLPQNKFRELGGNFVSNTSAHFVTFIILLR